ncbi:MAG: phosphate ABC transporter substrate-binding protein [Pseudomonadota bacterium]|nr:phosphate ABC transporter substrate-binding protein [Pseudomonadota bacterium]
MIRVAWAIAGIALSWGAGAASAEVVAVVSARSSLATLSKSQVADIFLGKSIRFPDGSLAVPIDQAEGSATREEFYLAFAGKSPAQLNAHWSKIIFTGRGQPPPEVANGVAVKRRLAENPNAIGYIEPALVDASVKVVLIP